YQVPRLARFRVTLFQERGHMAASLRRIAQQIPSITDLGLPLILRDHVKRPRGLILVCGPAGSGKSTTLAAMINEINSSRSANVLTLDDPIEHIHVHKYSIVTQREVGVDTSSYHAGLGCAVTAGADVVAVGRMPDL